MLKLQAEFPNMLVLDRTYWTSCRVHIVITFGRYIRCLISRRASHDDGGGGRDADVLWRSWIDGDNPDHPQLREDPGTFSGSLYVYVQLIPSFHLEKLLSVDVSLLDKVIATTKTIIWNGP